MKPTLLARALLVLALPFLACLLVTGSAAAQSPADARSLAAARAVEALPAAFAKDWILKSADNICGLKDANQLSNPAVIDYDAALAATPEMKKIKDQKIDPNSPEGIRLSNAALDRLTKACEEIRTQLGHCSVWKEIRHKDGRVITDITDKVKAQF
ncbi:MAG: hypothetical protein L6Q99_21320 [Planctomycetes bacterium]|nr:hypothetical protein [Planctomycetota bacterium]